MEETVESVSNNCCRCTQLEKELKETCDKLTAAKRELSKLERLHAITNDYNEDLRRQLETLNGKLHSLKSCTSAAVECKSSAGIDEVENDSSAGNKSFVSPESYEKTSVLESCNGSADAVRSFMDDIRKTLESDTGQTGFTFDTQTGMYYDHQSGYYYDAEKSLYYEPHSGCYYFYDCISQTYQFHSQVDATSYATLSHVIFRKSENSEQLIIDKKMAKNVSHTQSKCRRNQTCQHQKQSSHIHMKDETNKTNRQLIRKCLKQKYKRMEEKRKIQLAKSADLLGKLPCLSEYCTEILKDTFHSDISEKQRYSAETKEESLNSEVLPGILGTDEITSTNLESKNMDATKFKSDSASDSNTSDIDFEKEMDLEDGEVRSDLSSSSMSDCEELESCSDDTVDPPGLSYIIPGIRVIVKTSNCLPVGKLYIITCMATATIGRDETLNHMILISDPLVSKMHCDIKYSKELQQYVITDHASQCGTYVNGKRLSEAKVLSEPCALYNGDSVQISQTLFDLHIHPGHDTCFNCEPGNLQKPIETSTDAVVNKQEKEQQRKWQLKALKKKYGLSNLDHKSTERISEKSQYLDRAAERRATCGSEDAHRNDDLPASVYRAISTDNVGHKLLSKLGWKDGESLGKSQQGIKEPIHVGLRIDHTAGLGSGSLIVAPDDVAQAHLCKRWLRAQQRYNDILKTEAEKKTIQPARVDETFVGNHSEQYCHEDTFPVEKIAYKNIWVRGEDLEPSS